MKINGLSTYQITDEVADIVLSVEFSNEETEDDDLTATTVWVTYDLKGRYLQSNIADEGLPVNLTLTGVNLKDVMQYIDDNNLKAELLREMKKIESNSFVI